MPSPADVLLKLKDSGFDLNDFVNELIQKVDNEIAAAKKPESKPFFNFEKKRVAIPGVVPYVERHSVSYSEKLGGFKTALEGIKNEADPDNLIHVFLISHNIVDNSADKQDKFYNKYYSNIDIIMKLNRYKQEKNEEKKEEIPRYLESIKTNIISQIETMKGEIAKEIIKPTLTVEEEKDLKKRNDELKAFKTNLDCLSSKVDKDHAEIAAAAIQFIEKLEGSKTVFSGLSSDTSDVNVCYNNFMELASALLKECSVSKPLGQGVFFKSAAAIPEGSESDDDPSPLKRKDTMAPNQPK